MKKTSTTPLSDEELVSIIESRKSAGLNADTSGSDGDELSQRRENLLARYKGSPYGDERAGQSQVTTRECLEAVEWALPPLMRIFAASGKIGEFTSEGAEDETQAAIETAAVNDAFYRHGGFMMLYVFIKDLLMFPNSYCKVYWDERVRVRTEKLEGVLPEQLTKIENDENTEIIAQNETTAMQEVPGFGMMSVPVFDLEVRVTQRKGYPRIEEVPPEELVVDSKHGKVSLEEADFVCHSPLKSLSDLIAMGYDEDIIMGLTTENDTEDEDSDRHEEAEGSGYNSRTDDVSGEMNKLVRYDEAYLLLDYDGDGIAERRRIARVGDTILDNEPDDYMPIVGATAVPMPHVHAGISWMELVEDIQKIDTTLLRQLLNNLYRTNNPRPVVGRGVNMNDLLNDLPNAPIRTKNMDALRMEPTQPVIGQVLPMFEELNRRKESRNGTSSRSMGLSDDTLSRVTEGVQLGSMEQNNQRLELLARLIAELGMKQILLKTHHLLRTHQDTPYEVKIKGKWTSVNPSQWRERTTIEASVGLGTGNTQAQTLALSRVIDMQKEMVAGGLMGVTITPDDLYNSAEKMVELTGLNNAERYFTPVEEAKQWKAQQPPPPEDPLAKAQLELVQVENKKIMVKAQTDKMQMQQKMAEMQLKLRQAISDSQHKGHDLKRKDLELLIDTLFREAQLQMQDSQELNALQTQALDLAEKLTPEVTDVRSA